MTYRHEHIGHLLAHMVVETAAQRTPGFIGEVIKAEHFGQCAVVRDDWQTPHVFVAHHIHCGGMRRTNLAGLSRRHAAFSILDNLWCVHMAPKSFLGKIAHSGQVIELDIECFANRLERKWRQIAAGVDPRLDLVE